MSYARTTWVDDVTPISSSNMNNIEIGMEEHADLASTTSVSGHVILATNDDAFVGTNGDKALTSLALRNIIATTAVQSSNLRASLDAQSVNEEYTYIKVKAFTMKISGTVNVNFSMRTTHTNGSALGRIYRNGVAYGTEQINSTTTYVEYSETLYFNAGDTCELWLRGGGTIHMHVINFRLFFDPVYTLLFDLTPSIPLNSYDIADAQGS